MRETQMANVRLARELANEIEGVVSRVGLLVRVFHRAKSVESAKSKVARKSYSASGKRVQDMIGIRIVLYFADDIDIVRQCLMSRYRLDNETIDHPDSETFRPTRLNLVFGLSSEFAAALESPGNVPCDKTFEVQIRTVFAEGWHEVEHDLRYKCPEDWEDAPDLSRALNGVAATLETSEWSMLQLFDELAHRQYKARNWIAMLRHKFRLRITGDDLLFGVRECLDSDPAVAKAVFRFDRTKLLKEIYSLGISLPLTPTNIIYIILSLSGVGSTVESFVPEPVRDEVSRAILLREQK